MINISDCFSASYAEARDKFRTEARSRDARIVTYEHPLKGPDGGDLAADIAVFGPAAADRALVMMSGTHGVEGFCGSGCQIAYMRSGWYANLPDNTALFLLHAHNPHGFAHLRRVTEDNVDLNRNFVDFDAAPPANAGYDEVHQWVLPDDWDGDSRAAADAGIAGYIAEHGMFAFQAALSGGQYGHADGLFYGGDGPTWSRRMIEQFCAEELARFEAVGLIDFHTGLGARGYGELIATGGSGDPGFERQRLWYGDEVKSPEMGESVSAVVKGTIEEGYTAALPGVDVTVVAIEYGTLPPADVLQALRADNWLYLRGEIDSDTGREVKREIRDAFYGDDDAWKELVWQRAREVTEMALAGLSKSD
jgi:hypothetical protein